MNPLRVLSVMACLLAVTWAGSNDMMQSNSASGSLKPSNWLTTSELEDTPSLDEISLEKLENMPVEKGAKLMRKLCKYFNSFQKVSLLKYIISRSHLSNQLSIGSQFCTQS